MHETELDSRPCNNNNLKKLKEKTICRKGIPLSPSHSCHLFQEILQFNSTNIFQTKHCPLPALRNSKLNPGFPLGPWESRGAGRLGLYNDVNWRILILKRNLTCSNISELIICSQWEDKPRSCRLWNASQVWAARYTSRPLPRHFSPQIEIQRLGEKHEGKGPESTVWPTINSTAGSSVLADTFFFQSRLTHFLRFICQQKSQERKEQ